MLPESRWALSQSHAHLKAGVVGFVEKLTVSVGVEGCCLNDADTFPGTFELNLR